MSLSPAAAPAVAPLAPSTFSPLLIAGERCKGCELCIVACPKGVLVLDTSVVNRLGYHPVTITEPGRCTSCALLRARLPGRRLHRPGSAAGALSGGGTTAEWRRSGGGERGARPRRVLMKGNEAIAEAVIQAGCDAYFGYPITPQAELYLAGSELPVVVVDVMRGGPGLGSIQPSQSDYLLRRRRLAAAPSRAGRQRRPHARHRAARASRRATGEGRAMTATTPAPRVVHRRPELLTERSTHYCPGCGHGVIHRLLAEVLGELGLGPRTIAVAPVGCAVFVYDYLALDFVEAPHGRAPAVATGIRRVRPDAFVLTYQGDGDLAAIGTAEIVHAAARGERITVVFVNNGIYGMTGGQMAPTTLLGQRTTSSPAGRDAAESGYPLRITEMLAQLPGVAYAARGAIADPAWIGRTKSYLRRACEVQLEGRGLAIVEVLASCPVGWEMTPRESIAWLRERMMAEFPPGVLVDRGRAEAASPGRTTAPEPQRPEA